MDLNNIKKQVSNLTLYDIKAGVRKMQNGRLSAAIAATPYHSADWSI